MADKPKQVAMSNVDWDKKEIQRLARESGKPLEVRCAEAFIKAKWNVRIGTYYRDTCGELRELDFWAERILAFEDKDVQRGKVEWTVPVRVLGSCKGFPKNASPVTYSISSQSLAIEQPLFMCYSCGLYGSNVTHQLQKTTAEWLLTKLSASSRQVVGFDIFQREEDKKKNSKEPFKYSRKGDRDLYKDGLDSSIQATIFYSNEDKRKPLYLDAHKGFIALNLPLLVFSLPFWDIPIDTGDAGEPEIQSAGYHITVHPSDPPPANPRPPEPLASILYDVANITYLTEQLDALVLKFRDKLYSMLHGGI